MILYYSTYLGNIVVIVLSALVFVGTYKKIIACLQENKIFPQMPQIFLSFHIS